MIRFDYERERMWLQRVFWKIKMDNSSCVCLLWELIPLLLFFLSESLHRLCYQCQTADPLYATEPAVLSVPLVEVCGLSTVWVLHHDHDCSQHCGAHDEGQSDIFLLVAAESLESRLTAIKVSLIQFQINAVFWTFHSTKYSKESSTFSKKKFKQYSTLMITSDGNSGVLN